MPKVETNSGNPARISIFDSASLRRRSKLRGKSTYGLSSATEMRKSHRLLVNRTRRAWGEKTAESLKNPRDAILIAQKAPTCSRANLSWGRMHMQNQQ